MRRVFLAGSVGVGMAFFSMITFAADYAQDIQNQIASVNKNHPQKNANYFHDMGIIVRKAEDAELSDLAAGEIRKLMKEMETFIAEELQEINTQFSGDAFQAARRLADFTRVDRYYKPSENFLNIGLGQSLNSDLIQFRANAIEDLKTSCSDAAILRGVQAIKKTGLLMTGSSAEIQALRDLSDGVSCCLGWKPELSFSRSQPFETFYEMGLSTEEAKLKLDSSRGDLAAARWSGEWIYRVSGREGRGEGVSQATLVYRKGEETATLSISPSRVSSSGRMNFPNALSGEKRTLLVDGNPINPSFGFLGQSVKMTGCKAEHKKGKND